MSEHLWWQRGTVYQVYPRSFQDTDRDGVGDLEGIRRRLDYVTWLGVDAIWISPIYPSPMADFGYDVADYCDVHPLFGTLATFDRLVADAHARGIKVILDVVPSHTSDQHAWFRDSRSSRNAAKRDWYIWRDGRGENVPPNNWVSNFGGPAWTFDPATGQWYLHGFLREQPDLNWRNPAVQDAVIAAMRFWLDRGVDGFRIDVMWLMVKDAEFRDNPPNPDYRPGQPEINRLLQVHSADQPEVHAVVAAMRRAVDAYDERVLIGEIYLPVDRLMTYYGANRDGAHLPFNFQMIFATWTAPALGRMIADYEAALPPGGWPNWVLGNHDQLRVAARLGPAQARVAAMLLLTLRGTPTLYYGDELGIARVDIPPEAAQDPWSRNEPGFGRDASRTPFHWDASANAGFTAGRPWLPLDPAYPVSNVAVEREDSGSMLNLYRHLLATRRGHAALSVGGFTLLASEGDVLAYERRHGDERVVVALNLGREPQALPDVEGLAGGRLLASTFPDRGSGPPTDGLRPDEGVVILLVP